MVGIDGLDPKYVEETGRGLIEGNAVFSLIGLRFRFVPFESIVHHVRTF